MIITYDNIQPIYDITEDGIIRNIKTNKILTGSPDKDGYRRYSLSRQIEPYVKTYKAHRLVMITFKPVENFQELQVNHIDGNKENNSLSNLEWCTCKENIAHALEHKLIYKNRKIISVEDCKVICQWLEQGYAPKMVAQKLYPEDVDKYTIIIADIKRRKNWADISCDYNVDVPYKYGSFRSSYTIFQIEDICKLIASNKTLTAQQIAEQVFNKEEITKPMLKMIQQIKRKEKYIDVSKYFF